MPSDSLIHAAAGSLGGMTAMAITYPLVAISTRAQVESKKAGQSTLQALQRILAQEGISGLFAGLESSLLGIAITNGVFYLFFEESRAFILRRKAAASGTLSTLESILASFAAGCATSIISNPIWVVNTRQTVHASLSDSSTSGTLSTTIDPRTGEKKLVKKLGFLETISSIYNNDGILAFFRGLGPALILVINPIIAYTAFEQLKNIIIARRTLATSTRLPTGKQGALSKATVLPLTDLDNFLLGAVTKLLATSLTYPYLVVKSRMQAGKGKYSNALQGLLKIIKDEGVGTLYNGLASKLVQSVLTAAFLFASKERFYLLTKELLRKTAKAVPVVKA